MPSDLLWYGLQVTAGVFGIFVLLYIFLDFMGVAEQWRGHPQTDGVRPLYPHPSPSISDEMVERACVAASMFTASSNPEAARWPIDYEEQEADEMRAFIRVALEAALTGASAAGEADTKRETYYSKGKNAEYFERLPNKEFAWALTCASQDLNDSDENVSAWMPVSAMLSSAADRISAAPVQPEASAVGEADWRDDPSADERWSAGLDYGMTQLCVVLGVNSQEVDWDAATETLDGDVQSVVWKILTKWGGDDWRKAALVTPADDSGPVGKENVAYFTNDAWGGYWQTVYDGKPYNFRGSTFSPSISDEMVERYIAAYDAIPAQRHIGHRKVRVKAALEAALSAAPKGGA